MHRAVSQEDHLLEMEDAGERFIHARMMAIRDAMRDLPQFIYLQEFFIYIFLPTHTHIFMVK